MSDEFAKVARRLSHANSISDWEYRVGRALWRQSDPAKVEVTLHRWIAKGHDEVARNLPLITVIGYAWERVKAAPLEDPAVKRLAALQGFAQTIREQGFRIQQSYLDRLLQARRGGLYYAVEIEAEAFRLGEASGWTLDPVEAYHESLLIYFAKAGCPTKRRRLLTMEDCMQRAAKTLNDETNAFAKDVGAKVFRG